jgi:hypothetical protein
MNSASVYTAFVLLNERNSYTVTVKFRIVAVIAMDEKLNIRLAISFLTVDYLEN